MRNEIFLRNPKEPVLSRAQVEDWTFWALCWQRLGLLGQLKDQGEGDMKLEILIKFLVESGGCPQASVAGATVVFSSNEDRWLIQQLALCPFTNSAGPPLHLSHSSWHVGFTVQFCSLTQRGHCFCYCWPFLLLLLISTQAASMSLTNLCSSNLQ